MYYLRVITTCKLIYLKTNINLLFKGCLVKCINILFYTTTSISDDHLKIIIVCLLYFTQYTGMCIYTVCESLWIVSNT